MCFPSVSAQGYWCFKVERAVPSLKHTFFTSGISLVSLQSADAKLLLCQMWTLTVFNLNSRCWILLQWNTHRKSGRLNLHDTPSSFFWWCSVQQTIQVLSTARAWRSLPAVCCASIPEGADGTDEVRSVSQAIKESVSRKMEKPNWDWKHSLPVYLMYHLGWS